MKKYIFAVVIALLAITLTACGGNSADVDVQSQADALVTNCTFEASMEPVDADELSFYFDVPEGTELAGYLADGVSKEIVVCALTQSSDAAKALAASFETYAADQKQEAERYQPQEVERIENGCTIRTQGNNAVLVICADTDSVNKVLGGK